LLFSFLIVVCAQPDWSPIACFLTSTVGYALFWKGMLYFRNKASRFLIAIFWFGLISITHLSWLSADRYVGFYIYFLILFLFLSLGIQFGLVSLLVCDAQKMGILRILAISGTWTLMEWTRLFFLSGYSWDPVGLSLTGTLISMQMASIVGVFGMSFWVFLTNLVALRLSSNKTFKQAGSWLLLALIPYLYGSLHFYLHDHWMEQERHHSLSALLVQTSLLPEEKLPVNGSMPLSPPAQWSRILDLLSTYLDVPHDLIVLPEGCVPYGTDLPLYQQAFVSETFKNFFPQLEDLPESLNQQVGNRYWAQALANAHQTSVVIGLEDVEYCHGGEIKAYNAAFLFRPYSLSSQRYEKRILVPMGEYIPFQWCKKILSKYGILDSYTPGDEAKIFQVGQTCAGISICYEETFGNLMRANRQKGAELLINISNDVWYPLSRLPVVHYLHGRLRAIEQGLPMVRACNTGLTCGIDALGRSVGQLPYESKRGLSQPGVLSILLPLYSYHTFYTIFGDSLVISISLFFITSFFIYLFVQRKKFLLKYLNIYPLRKTKV